MKIHHFSAEEAFASLQSGPDGLSPSEAARRLAEYGPNMVEKVRSEFLFFRFLKGFTHFFAIILWVAAALAFFAEIHDPGQGMAVLGFAITGVIIINGVFSFWQEYRAEQALQALQKLLPQEATVMRGGRAAKVPVSELVPGDLLLLEGGDNIPADARLVEAFGVRVNNATVTGESLPHARSAASSSEPEFMHSSNVLLAGTSMVSGEARALVFATGSHSAFGQIAHLTLTTTPALSPLQKEIARLSRLVALFSLGLGIVFFMIGRAIGLPFWGNFIFAIGIIVANVPEGLLPTVTLALAMGSQRMARRNALIRHLPAVEALGSTTVICTDKTGTLTQNKMAVRQIYIDGTTCEAINEPLMRSLAQSNPLFFAVALHCHDLKPGGSGQSAELMGDPMEMALVRMAADSAPVCSVGTRITEIPFDSQRRRLSTIHRAPDGPMLYMKGAPEVVLPRCQHAGAPGNLQQAQSLLTAKGLRVLAFAHRRLPEQFDLAHAEEELEFDGLVGLEDPPRSEVPHAIRQCQAAGIKVIMVTGDHPHTAEAIAREIGLVRSASPTVITGDQLKRLSNTQLQLALDAPEILFARVTADQKMRIVSVLKRKQEIVAVTGDGVNDAPALKKADIGIAMGKNGTDVARESADIILLDDNFASIVAAIEEGRTVYANIRKFLTYILTSNVPELVPYLAFVLCKIPLPLTIIQILAVDLGTDMLPALALGAEPPNPQTMQEPPRSSKERLLNWPLILRSYGFLGLIEAAAAMAGFYFVLKAGGWKYGETLASKDPLYLQATTACLSAIIVMQAANVFLCRSRRQSVAGFGVFSNPLILWGVAVEIGLILLIDYTRWGNTIFGTAPIEPRVWLFVLPFALVMLLLEEVRKWVVRRWGRTTETSTVRVRTRAVA